MLSYFIAPCLNMKSVDLTKTSQPLLNRSLFNLTRIHGPMRKPAFLSCKYSVFTKKKNTGINYEFFN